MNKLIIILSVFFVSSIFAAEQHYVNGIEGIKCASVPPPGKYLRVYNAWYNTDQLNNGAGDEIKGLDLDVDVFAVVPRFVYVSSVNILGANYLWDLIVPLQKVDFELGAFGLDESTTGLGDICLEPFALAWNRERFDAIVAFGWIMPTGKYDKNDPSSTGKDMWTTMLTLGGTYYFDEEKSISLSVLSRYETHTKTSDTDFQKGDDFHFEWGFGKNINGIDIGISGYAQWELDKGDDPDKDKVYAIGPEISGFVKSIKSIVSFRALREFDAENRTEGTFYSLVITKPL